MDKNTRQLDIYIDESGNFDEYSKHNLLYSVAFVLVDSNDDNANPISIFGNKLSKIVGGNHFVHTGNLIRGEKPYEGMLLKQRQDLFYILFLFAKYSKYKVICSLVEKKRNPNDIYNGIQNSVMNTIKQLQMYQHDYKRIVIHYDNGQEFLKETLISAFQLFENKVIFIKTMQQESPFMQVADMFSYFELLKYKINKSGLSKHEINFFGLTRKIKKDYIKQIENKYLYF